MREIDDYSFRAGYLEALHDVKGFVDDIKDHEYFSEYTELFHEIGIKLADLNDMIYDKYPGAVTETSTRTKRS